MKQKIKVIVLFLSIFMVISIFVNAFELHSHIDETNNISTHLVDLSHGCTHSNKSHHHDHNNDPFMYLFDECCCGVITLLFCVSGTLFFTLFHFTYNIPRNCFFNSSDISLIDEPPRS
jgi:hypothetical protein